ncbi:MAG: copper-binding protein [bacterium]|nr:copper-binding protein [bacterium]MDW8164118.1 copper-binding protein [Candidatus Omnitrophota bacterium]
MKKFLTYMSGLLFLASTCISIYAGAENTPKVEKQEKEKLKGEISHVYGEITKIDLESKTVTIKKEDGTEITLKATTEKTQEMIKNLKVGDKVKAVYTKNKEGENVIIKIVIPGEKGKEKVKKEKNK